MFVLAKRTSITMVVCSRSEFRGAGKAQRRRNMYAELEGLAESLSDDDHVEKVDIFIDEMNVHVDVEEGQQRRNFNNGDTSRANNTMRYYESHCVRVQWVVHGSGNPGLYEADSLIVKSGYYSVKVKREASQSGRYLPLGLLLTTTFSSMLANLYRARGVSRAVLISHKSAPIVLLSTVSKSLPQLLDLICLFLYNRNGGLMLPGVWCDFLFL
ncbi:hypothetical protein T4D_422, partial [Trichinella pseudospiralis]